MMADTIMEYIEKQKEITSQMLAKQEDAFKNKEEMERKFTIKDIEIGKKFSFYLFPFGKSFPEIINEINSSINTEWKVSIIENNVSKNPF